MTLGPKLTCVFNGFRGKGMDGTDEQSANNRANNRADNGITGRPRVSIIVLRANISSLE